MIDIETLSPELRDRLIESEIEKNLAEAASVRLTNEARERDLSVLRNLSDSVHTYFFYAIVDEESVRKCIHELSVWSRRDPGCDITVIFNSPGGVVGDGFALFDFLRGLSKRGHKVTTKCLGTAASMGALLMQAGDERIMAPNSFMLVHQISSAFQGNSAQLEDHRRLISKLEDKALDILSERSSLTRAAIKRQWSRKDWVLDADEAVSAGFADRVDA